MPNGSDLLKFAAIGGAGYLAWEWWQNNQTPAPAAPTGAAAAADANAGGPVSANPTGSNPAASIPKYSGPSLDSLFSQLVAAAKTGMQGGDNQVSCPNGMGAVSRGVLRPPVMASSDPGARTFAAGGPTGTLLAAPRVVPAPAAPASCSTPLATPDVWNWYLVNRTQAGISSAPSPSDAFPGANLSTPITAAQYWAGVSPLLSKQLGMSGLGAFGASFRRSGMGLYVGRGMGATVADNSSGPFVGPPLIDMGTVNSSDPTGADFAALQTSAAAGGFDTNQGSYSVDPLSGQVAFTPVSVPPKTSLISGISNGVLAVGAGAVVLLVGIAGGRR